MAHMESPTQKCTLRKYLLSRLCKHTRDTGMIYHQLLSPLVNALSRLLLCRLQQLTYPVNCVLSGMHDYEGASGHAAIQTELKGAML